ncbi:major facilitator superfamily domain-containing protein [Mycena rosella]|uniref:Major facilitator superfamily domain-containing protein n=1 Tax=Mycena rosella TaxID=1033263 RepID=A0AAD7D095_MYCRO|nr:major facilitator superfamily domain-containing protein [Mycena rosella]
MSTGRSNEVQPLLGGHGRFEDVPVTPLPKAQLTALCISRLSDIIAHTQIFPYINELMTVLHVTDDPSNIGTYSGLAESVSAIGQIITIFHWERLSCKRPFTPVPSIEKIEPDVFGRRPILLVGALGVTVVSLLFGLCRTFVQVVILRAISGVLSGNVAVYQVVLGEITDFSNTPAAYPLFGCIYPLGSTIGPLIGGFFSNVSFGYSFLESYPYFLPGFICACFSMLGFVLIYCFLEETLPRDRTNLLSTGDDPSIEGSIRTERAFLSFCQFPAYSAAHTVVFVLLCSTPIENGGLSFSATEIGCTLAYRPRYSPYSRLYGRVADFVRASSSFNRIARLGLDADTAHPEVKNKIALWIAIAAIQLFSRVGSLGFSANVILVRSNSPSTSDLGAANSLNIIAMALARCVSPSSVSIVFTLSVNNNLLWGNLWVVGMVLISALGYFISLRVEDPGADAE